MAKERAKGTTSKREAEEATVGKEKLPPANGVRVLMFDHSVENHFDAMDRISELCGEAAEGGLDESELQHVSSSVTFLREWRLFNYQSRDVRFAYDIGSAEPKAASGGINLPQFSSATIPKEGLSGDAAAASLQLRDFIMYVGGPIWGLDWCPRARESPDSHFKLEFIAISAHPPGSSYHKIGAPLSGRGLVQIWSLLTVSRNEEDILPLEKPKRGRKNSVVAKEKPTEIKRPRGRPRKKPINDNVAVVDSNGPCIEPHHINVPEKSSNLLAIECIPGYSKEDPVLETSACSSSQEIGGCYGQDLGISSNIINHSSLESSSTSCSVPNDLSLPRIVLCLAHNGKVAWDVKWRPSNENDSSRRHRMGFLALLLGNGSLEVWDIPLPNTIKVLYSSLQEEGTDPRFIKLEPVFRSAMLKSGGIQSIPLTVEWSASPPHEFLLAGCHDGTVALWKFSASFSSKDTRALLCFSADTFPIRTVAWAPIKSDSDSANVILTAGHGGLKFWDIRDPFRPLWDLPFAPRIINSLDWLPDPRCVVLSFDDGTMRTLSLTKAAYDVPVTGKPFVGTKHQGLHSYICSSFAIWSVQVSRPTGMVAYCSADGTVLRFQLTKKAVDKDPSRNRAPHFLCGSLTEDESIVTINTSLTNTPFPLEKSLNKHGDTPTALRDLSDSNQKKKADDKLEQHPASNDQNLALCYGDDPEVEYENEETLASLKKKKPLKSGPSTKKKPENNMALPLAPVDNESKSTEEKEIQKASKFEVFPSKAVAMHRVRWNMNKGSERWLCYGGAAGIVRCQEIVLSAIDKKWAIKKSA